MVILKDDLIEFHQNCGTCCHWKQAEGFATLYVTATSEQQRNQLRYLLHDCDCTAFGFVARALSDEQVAFRTQPNGPPWVHCRYYRRDPRTLPEAIAKFKAEMERKRDAAEAVKRTRKRT